MFLPLWSLNLPYFFLVALMSKYFPSEGDFFLSRLTLDCGSVPEGGWGGKWVAVGTHLIDPINGR